MPATTTLYKGTSQQNSFTTKPPRGSKTRTLWAINPRGAHTIHAQIDSLYYGIVIVPLDACYNNTLQRHFTAIYVCNQTSTRV